MGGEVHRFLDGNDFRRPLVAKIGEAPIASVDGRFKAGSCSCRIIPGREFLELLVQLLVNIAQLRRHEVPIARILRGSCWPRLTAASKQAPTSPISFRRTGSRALKYWLSR